MNINLANIDFCPGGKSATLTETTAEILLSETEKVILPPEGTDGFNKVTITHAPVEERVSATITENGTHTITPSEGFGAMVGVSVNVNVSGGGDVSKYYNKVPTADDAGLKEIGWDDESVNYFKYNNYAYPWEADKYKVSDANKQIVINNKSDIATYRENPDFQYCPKFDTSAETNMNNMFNGCSYLTYIPQLDTSNVTDMSKMFYLCGSLITIPQLDTSKAINMGYMFSHCTLLTSIHQLNTQSVTNMDYMFEECSSLTTIPQLNTQSVTNMSKMFSNCTLLTSIPQLNTSNVTNMGSMFSGCSSLTSIPQLNTSNVTDMNNMFENCSSLTSISQLDTSKVTNIGSMFENCSSLTSIPLLDTHSITSMGYMFSGCSSLTSIPQLNTSNVTNMRNMFEGCSSLTSIPQLDTSKVKDMRYMFSNCDSINIIPKLDATSLSARFYFGGTGTDNMFGDSNGHILGAFTTFGGLTGLKLDLDLHYCNNLTKESLLNVINEAADVTASPKTLTLGVFNLQKLTDEDKAIATNKGWTLK